MSRCSLVNFDTNTSKRSKLVSFCISPSEIVWVFNPLNFPFINVSVLLQKLLIVRTQDSIFTVLSRNLIVGSFIKFQLRSSSKVPIFMQFSNGNDTFVYLNSVGTIWENDKPVEMS